MSIERVWVDRYVEAVRRPARRDADDGRPPMEWVEPATYDVLGVDGTLYGTVVLPPNSANSYANGPFIWSVRRGDLGEQYVVRLRIVPGGT